MITWKRRIGPKILLTLPPWKIMEDDTLANAITYILLLRVKSFPRMYVTLCPPKWYHSPPLAHALKGLRKNSEILVNLRRSSGQSMRERSDRWPLFLVFKSVPGCIEGIPGHCAMFRGIMGCSRGVPVCSGVVPGCSGLFQGCSKFYRHPTFLVHCIVKTGVCHQMCVSCIHNIFVRNRFELAFINTTEIVL